VFLTKNPERVPEDLVFLVSDEIEFEGGHHFPGESESIEGLVIHPAQSEKEILKFAAIHVVLPVYCFEGINQFTNTEDPFS
jgi:hypothetical protein